MKFIEGSEYRCNECGGNYHGWYELTSEEVERCLAAGGAIEPVGSFHTAACAVVKEVREDGKVVDVSIVANPTQNWWDDADGACAIWPSRGGKIEITRLDNWFNPYPYGCGSELKRCLWVEFHKHLTKAANGGKDVLRAAREFAQRHHTVFAICEEGL